MHEFSFPVKEPVLVFTVILFIILLVPVILRKTKIPSIVGLIVVGIIIGPHATNFIAENDIIELFGRVGLLYIMFLAGLEIEFVEFRKNSTQGIFFGIATFALPFTFGYYASTYLLSLSLIPAMLVGALLASHTLIAFPVVSKLGINKTTAINTAISGTVITDTIVLVILAFCTAQLNEGKGGGHMIKFFLSFGVFTFGMFYLLPKLSTWFYKNIANDGVLQYLYALAMMFASSFIAELAGAEPIIGAFFAGLALNKLIPASSTLMNRIDFVGNTLFIPVFLISVGMLVNLSVLFSGYEPALYATVLLILGISSKWLAAGITKLIFKQSMAEMNTIFGLTSARAAATLAVALVGYDYGVLSKDIFNGTILLIMLTSLYSSYVTQKYGKKLAMEESKKLPDNDREESDAIIVPIANPKNIESLIDLAIMLRNPKSKDPIYSLAIVKDNEEAGKRIIANKPLIDKVSRHAASSGITIQGINRVDVNIPNAIVKASKELMAGSIVMGIGGRRREISRVFGSMLERILEGTASNVIVSHLPRPLNITEELIVFIPENAEMEYGFKHWFETLAHLSSQLSAELHFYMTPASKPAFEKAAKEVKTDQRFTIKTDPDWFNFNPKPADPENKMYVFINARPQTISFNQNFWALTYKLPDYLITNNVLVIYPSQYE